MLTHVRTHLDKDFSSGASLIVWVRTKVLSALDLLLKLQPSANQAQTGRHRGLW